MLELNPETDLSFMTGQTLGQVCFGVHDLHLNFSEGASIRIESGVEFQALEGPIETFQSFAEAASRFALLLDQTVTSWEAAEDHSLCLIFSGGSKVWVFGDNQPNESFLITHGSITIVV